MPDCTTVVASLISVAETPESVSPPLPLAVQVRPGLAGGIAAAPGWPEPAVPLPVWVAVVVLPAPDLVVTTLPSAVVVVVPVLSVLVVPPRASCPGAAPA